MDALTRENFDLVINNDKNILIYIYKDNDPKSMLGLDPIEQLDRMYAKDFSIYILNSDTQPEVASALDSRIVPELVFIKNSRIVYRSTEQLYTNQILDHLR